MTFVYLIVIEAVYDHGTGGIFTTREAAEEHALALFDGSDGHHAFRVEQIPLDVPIRHDDLLRAPGPPPPQRMHRREISYVSWEDQ